MYQVTERVKNLFQNYGYHYVEISLDGQDDSLLITEDDIVQGGLTIDRYCVSGDKIEVGSAIAGELKLTLNNRDGRFNDVRFEGADLHVKIGVKNPDEPNADPDYIPMGYFTVDQIPRKLSTISLVALDRMVQFDKVIDKDSSIFSNSITIEELIRSICRERRVTLSSACALSALPNYNRVISNIPQEDDLTYRQLLQWCAEITGTCAYIDWEGCLRLEWYKETDVVISEAQRYSSDLQENDICVTGVIVENSDKTAFVGGQDGYVLNISSNSLIQGDAQSLADNVWNSLTNDNAFAYRPYSCSIKPMPYLYPLDKIIYVDHEENPHATIITHTTFKIGGATSIEATGKSAQSDGYAAVNPLTKRDTAIINSVTKNINTTLNARLQAIIGFNDVMSNALGVYWSARPTANGSMQYYIHNEKELEDSMVIYTINEGGFAFTTQGWNDGNPTWQYGISKDGNAVLNYIYSKGIEVADVNKNYSTEILPDEFAIYYLTNKVLSVSEDRSFFTNAEFTKHMKCGKTQLIPNESGADLIVLD